MSYFDISEDDVKSLDGKVTIITGASSGIGLATSKLFLSKGAVVVGADLQELTEAIDSSKFSFIRTDVTSWEALVELFSKTHEKHGRIDIVFANAGVGPRVDYLSLQKDEEGRLIEPSKRVLDINFIAVTNQVALAVHYMKNQEPKGGNIILTASCTAYQRFVAPDYVAAKHGVVGLLRTMYRQLNSNEIRINAVAPSFTRTGLVQGSETNFKELGIEVQSAEAVAKSVGLLVTDPKRHGHCLYSYGGRYVEMEEPLQDTMLTITGKSKEWFEEPMREKMYAKYAEMGSGAWK